MSLTVADVVKELLTYNQSANFMVILDGDPVPFELCYGSHEEVSRTTCTDVCIFVDPDQEVER